jgi:hypothetical protein
MAEATSRTDQAAAAVSEAARLAAESTRRTTEEMREASRRTTEGLRGATQATRTYLEESIDLNRQFADAWNASAGAAVRSSLALQHAWLAGGLSLFDASTSSARLMLQQWVDVSQQAQQLALETWQSGERAAERATRRESAAR